MHLLCAFALGFVTADIQEIFPYNFSISFFAWPSAVSGQVYRAPCACRLSFRSRESPCAILIVWATEYPNFLPASLLEIVEVVKGRMEISLRVLSLCWRWRTPHLCIFRVNDFASSFVWNFFGSSVFTVSFFLLIQENSRHFVRWNGFEILYFSSRSTINLTATLCNSFLPIAQASLSSKGLAKSHSQPICPKSCALVERQLNSLSIVLGFSIAFWIASFVISE